MASSNPRFVIRAVDRKSSGYNGSYRSGRFWPSDSDTVIEIVDSDECPVVDNPEKPGQTMLDPRRLGRRAWDLLKTDGTLSRRPAEDNEVIVDPIPQTLLHSQVAKLVEENASLKSRLELLEQFILEAKPALPAPPARQAKPEVAPELAPAVQPSPAVVSKKKGSVKVQFVVAGETAPSDAQASEPEAKGKPEDGTAQPKPEAPSKA